MNVWTPQTALESRDINGEKIGALLGANVRLSSLCVPVQIPHFLAHSHEIQRTLLNRSEEHTSELQSP